MSQNKLKKPDRLTGKWMLSLLIKIVALAIFALFFDWLVLNAISQCCEGGVCIPDIYPQCRNPHYDEVYGAGYYDHSRR